MIRLLADENLHDAIVRGAVRQRPNLDIVRATEVGPRGCGDPEILAWSAENDRILLTHDRSTVPDFAYDRIDHGLAMPGVFVIASRFPIGPAIDEVLLLDECSDHEEWAGRVIHLPIG